MRLLSPYWSNQRQTSADIFNEMEKFFDAFAQPTIAAQKENTFVPACEVTEDANQYVIAADVPGVKKDQIKVELNENILTISGERKRGEATAVFKRSFSIPNTVDIDKIEAKQEDGVLTLRLPKLTVVKARTIEIQSNSGDSEKSNPPTH